MKNIWKFIFIFVFLFVGFFIFDEVNAEGYISFDNKNGNSFSISSNGEINNNSISGLTYDKDSNTLTFNNVKYDGFMHIYDLGDNFKIKLVGDNELVHIFGIGSLSIIGDGSLTVDSRNFHDDGVANDGAAISLSGGKLEISSESTVKLYSREDVIVFYDVNNNDLLKINNGDYVLKSLKKKEEFTLYENANVAIPSDSVYLRFSKVALKDGKKYGVDYYPDTGAYKIYNREIYFDLANDLYLFDDNENEATEMYYDIESLNSNGYQLLDEDVEIMNYNYTLGEVYEDTNNNRYVVFDNNIYNLTSNYFESKRYPFGERYYVTMNDSISMDSLSKVVKEVRYYTYVDLNELIISPKTIVSNPKTGNHTFLIISIVCFAFLIVIITNKSKKFN